jgi:Omp85 superfamily domain
MIRRRRTKDGGAAMGALAAVGLFAAASCLAGPEAPQASDAPSAPAGPPSGVARWLNPATAPFIPIPEIDVDPQSGVTLGVIATFIDVNDRGEIERITAPDVFHSQYFGWGAGISMYGYPSEDSQWLVTGSIKERVERGFDARYLAGQTRATPLSWSVETLYDINGTARFFGIGNETPDYNESTYVKDRAALVASLGYNFTPQLQLAWGTRWRRVDVRPGVLSGIPSIGTLYPDLNGLGNEHALEQTLTLTYDTRDSAIIPRSGARYLLYGGFASRSFGSSVAYSFFGADARCYFPVAEHITLVLHAAARYMPSAEEAPFWALSSLGGDRSIPNGQEPLRSDGADRYVDENLLATGAELRTRVAGFDAFGTRVSLELAPFIDAGKVFSNGFGNPLSDMHTAAGIGVRGVANPYVVGYVDVGYGRGKAVVFTGINYPF